MPNSCCICRPHGFVGANVTIPHKERALALSMPDARARAVGAANTLWYDDGELRSTNTDVEGFINNLDASAPGWDDATEALVLGAGGSSRAVVFGLLERGIKRVHLANRTIARAAGAGGSVRRDRSSGRLGCDRRVCCRARSVLVNTTSLGMHGQPAARDRCRPAAVGCRRRRPRLCAAARRRCWRRREARGLKTADGLGMLLHQAVRGFELWFGQRPEVTPELRALVEADLTKV